jgi:hypothetical protein
VVVKVNLVEHLSTAAAAAAEAEAHTMNAFSSTSAAELQVGCKVNVGTAMDLRRTASLQDSMSLL